MRSFTYSILRRLALAAFLVSVSLPAYALDFITATITVTNVPAGLTSNLVVNATTRSWTNDASASPSTLLQVTNTTAWAATNLLNHLTVYPGGTGLLLSQGNETNVVIKGITLTVTVNGGWGFVTYATNVLTSPTYTVRMPITIEAPTNQTNIASALVAALVNSTTALGTNWAVGSNYLTRGASPQQYVAGPVQFDGVLRASAAVAVTNGYTRTLTNINPVFSNAVNFGSAIRSEGSGGNSLQVGSNAIAAGTRSIAIGNSSVATNADTTAIGTGALATNQYAMALGNVAFAYGVDALAIGRGSLASTSFSLALGQGSSATANGAISIGAGSSANAVGSLTIGVGGSVSSGAYQGMAVGNGSVVSGGIGAMAIGPNTFSVYSNSLALGPTDDLGGFVSTTTTNQIRLGTGRHTTSIPGVLAIDGTQTNTTWTGTNVLNGRLDVTPRSNTGLANGYNSAVVFGSNTLVRFSGPSGAYTNSGFVAPGGPQIVWAQFDNPGLSFTILDESGLEATAANRILTGTGALVNSTNRVVIGSFLYDMTALRWRIISFR